MDCNVEGMYISESVTMNVGLQSQHREKKRKRKKRDLEKRDGPVDLIWQCTECKIGIHVGWPSVHPGDDRLSPIYRLPQVHQTGCRDYFRIIRKGTVVPHHDQLGLTVSVGWMRTARFQVEVVPSQTKLE